MELLLLNPVVHTNKKIVTRDENRGDERFPKASDGQAFFVLLDVDDVRDVDCVEYFSHVVNHTYEENSVVLI